MQRDGEPSTWRYRHRAPVIPAGAVIVFAVLFATFTTIRGFSWIQDTSPRVMPEVVYDGLNDPATWGSLVLATGLSTLLAYASRIHFAVWLAHGMAAVVFLALTVALLQSALREGAGWQHVTPIAGAFAWNIFLAWLTGPLPRSIGADR